MMIDSTAIHEELNQIAISFTPENQFTAIDALIKVRKALIEIEAETACQNAKLKMENHK
jgi:hypothetical protein